VSFPLFEKITVVGAEKHPLYKALTETRPKIEDGAETAFREKLKGYGMSPNPEPEVLWNFEKFLVSREGTVGKRFSPDTTPEDPSFVSAVKSELT
jgi:glutathione peroxidase